VRRRRIVDTRDEPTRTLGGETTMAGRNGCLWTDLCLCLVNGNRVQPNDSTVVVANRGRVVLVRLHMAMCNARMMGRIGLMHVLRCSYHRAQQRDGSQDVKGGAARAEHFADYGRESPSGQTP
jgi:hypothetical protein